MSIKAIDTVYKGYRFRSRLEARWAVFFDALGVEWEYEKAGYQFDDGTRYLPDFWLPEQHCWIEIKGEPPSKEEKLKAEKLFDESGQVPVIIFHGLPEPGFPGTGWYFEIGDSSGGEVRDYPVRIESCLHCGKMDFSYNDYKYSVMCFSDTSNDEVCYHINCRTCSCATREQNFARIISACLRAKQARFEHGECG